jgi:hypothetical protein
MKKLGVIYGVPSDVTCDDLAAISGSKAVRRLTPVNTQDTDQPYTALLTFEGDMPVSVQSTSFLRLRVQNYMPRSMQCMNCMMFGHTMTRCKNQSVCAYCALRGHSKDECNNRDQPQKCKCINCKGAHEATSHLCSKYQDNLATLKLAYAQNPPLPFKEAQRVLAEQRRAAPEQKKTEPEPKKTYASAVRNRGDRSQSRTRARLNSTVPAAPIQPAYIGPSGITLDKSEIESLVFTNKLLISLVANILNSNGDKEHLTPVSEALERALAKTNDVAKRHQIVIHESNQRMLDTVQNINLKISQSCNNVGVSSAFVPLMSCPPAAVNEDEMALSQSSSTDGALTIDLEARSPAPPMCSAPMPMSGPPPVAPTMVYKCQNYETSINQ